jgi:N-acetylmuramoyl-L-alanine amidase
MKQNAMKKTALLLVVTLTLMSFVDGRYRNALNSFVIIVDAGHGGQDSGSTTKDGISEKELTLSIALQIQKAGKEKGISVILTRTEDASLGLKERAALSEKFSADLFISLHVNSDPGDNSKSGIDCFIAENNPAYEESRNFSTLLMHELQTMNGITVNDTKTSHFSVLKNNRIPAVVIELGYLSNTSDFKFINSDNNQKVIADKIVSSILKYKE